MVVTAPTACSCRPRGLDGGTLATGVCVRRWVLITGLGFLKWVDSFFPRAAAPNTEAVSCETMGQRMPGGARGRAGRGSGLSACARHVT